MSNFEKIAIHDESIANYFHMMGYDKVVTGILYLFRLFVVIITLEAM